MRPGFDVGVSDVGYTGSGYETPGNLGDEPGFSHEVTPAAGFHLPVNFPGRVRPIHQPVFHLPVIFGTRTAQYVTKIVNGLPTYFRPSRR